MKSLTREELRDVIHGKSFGNRVPILYHLWIYPEDFEENGQELRNFLKEQPQDVNPVFLKMPDIFEAPEEEPDWMWSPYPGKFDYMKGIDGNAVITGEWDEIEDFYRKFPSADSELFFKDVQLIDDKRYNLAVWWYCLFERHWSLRGMENALTDFYMYPEQVHKLYQRLTDFYMHVMERTVEKYGVDGFFVSDDIGSQTSPLFSPAIFKEFFYPYYKQLIDRAHELGTEFWLHSCGNIEVFLPYFVELGLDVIHPLQKGTMDGNSISEKYGDKIALLVGFDVQNVIPFGTEDDVRKEVASLIKIYRKKDNRFLLTMGNRSTPDWKINSIKVLYDETMKLGERDWNGSET